MVLLLPFLSMIHAATAAVTPFEDPAFAHFYDGQYSLKDMLVELRDNPAFENYTAEPARFTVHINVTLKGELH